MLLLSGGESIDVADLGPDRERLKAADQWRAREVNYLDELYDLADRMPKDDSVRVSKVDGVATRVEKSGKQDSQAVLKVTVGAKTPEAASALLTAFERDNTYSKKYYLNTNKMGGGITTGTAVVGVPFTLVMKLNHREPGEYTRMAVFTPPARRGFIPPPPPDEGEDENP